MKKLALLLLIPLVTSCAPSLKDVEIKKREEIKVTDKFNSFYQIFPYSFADGNGDGKGDLKGIIDKLDYVIDMGYTAIWLNPVHTSNTYHKYNVHDYYSIDPQFGTLADYDALVKKCHDNDLDIILDLVYNHTGDEHAWFKKCMQAHIDGDVTNQYYDYYSVKYIPERKGVPEGYVEYKGTGYYYEARFTGNMPDLNLQLVLDDNKSDLAKDLENIIKYWLIDHDIDGFRLDACTSYFTGDIDKNCQFLSWIEDTARKYKEDVYVVGEVWTDGSTIANYYSKAKTDSFFQFENRDSFSKVIGNEDFYYFSKINIGNISSTKGEHVAAPFVANHDMTRLLGAAQGRSNPDRVKMMNALLQTCYGCTFSYYGDEIGMSVYGQDDQDYRQPMYWGDSYQVKRDIGTPCSDMSKIYPYPTVKEQLQDPDSIVNACKKINHMRLENPELARGSYEEIFVNEEGNLGVCKRSYNNSDIYVIYNVSNTLTLEYDIKGLNTSDIVSSLCFVKDSKAQLKGETTLVVPPLSVTILK